MPIKSILLISLTTIGMIAIFFGTGFIPSNTPIVPDAHASPPNNPSILGLFNEARKSSAVVDSTIGLNGVFKMDVNLTDAGQIKGFDINLTFTGASLGFVNSTYTGAKCPGCILQTITTSKLANTTLTDSYRLSAVDTDTNTPFVNGNGVLFRITFVAKGSAVASPIHISSTTQITNPGLVPYNPVDGYFDNRGNSASNFGISESPTTLTITRPLYASQTITGTTTVTISNPVNLGATISIALKALGIPKNTGVGFSINPCTAACSPILTFTINGGPKGGSTTTPSGNYSIPIIGNSTGTGVSGQVIRSTWLKLVVKPPPAPVYTFTTPNPTAFTQEAGSFTLITVNLALTSGANDSISLQNNCNPKINGVGTCLFKPQSGSFPLTAVLNVSSFANVQSGQLGIHKFNATATTTGTYSEVLGQQLIQFTLNLVRTHDVSASQVAVTRTVGVTGNFAYSGVTVVNPYLVNVTVSNMGTVPETFTVNATAKTVLTLSNNLKWVDTGGNTSAPYKTGETAVIDTDLNGLYGYGKTDVNVRFVNATTSPTETWAAGKAVVYDADGDGKYIVGKFVTLNDTIISGTVANNTRLKSDLKLKLVDCLSTSPVNCDNDQIWNCFAGQDYLGTPIPPSPTPPGYITPTYDITNCTTSGETTFYDTNGNGVFDTGETVIFGTTPSPKPVLKGVAPSTTTALSQGTLSFVDANYNGVLSTGADTVVFDVVGDGVFENPDIVVAPCTFITCNPTPSAGILIWSTSQTIAAGVTVTVKIQWAPANLASLPQGRYLIAGAAVPVSGEFLLSNNQVIIFPFTQRLKGDNNGDCRVDIADLGGGESAHFGFPIGSPGYTSSADAFNSGTIDISNLVTVSSSFGRQCA